MLVRPYEGTVIALRYLFPGEGWAVKNFVSELSGRGALLTLAVVTATVAAGFLAGRAIGTDEGGKTGSIPARVVTQQASAEVTTLGTAERIPGLQVDETKQSPVETEESGFTPSAEPEPPAPEPEQSSPPEVTVAPNG